MAGWNGQAVRAACRRRAQASPEITATPASVRDDGSGTDAGRKVKFGPKYPGLAESTFVGAARVLPDA
jgi:hypothetical protein